MNTYTADDFAAALAIAAQARFVRDRRSEHLDRETLVTIAINDTVLDTPTSSPRYRFAKTAQTSAAHRELIEMAL